MFNSQEFSWTELTVVIGGKDITGIRGIKYGEKQEKEPVYGKGNKPRAIQRGNKSYEGEVTLLQSELETLRANSATRSVNDLHVDVMVSYGNPENGDTIVTDKILGVEFNADEKALKQGDKFMEITLPFIALDVRNQSI